MQNDVEYNTTVGVVVYPEALSMEWKIKKDRANRSPSCERKHVKHVAPTALFGLALLPPCIKEKSTPTFFAACGTQNV